MTTTQTPFQTLPILRLGLLLPKLHAGESRPDLRATAWAARLRQRASAAAVTGPCPGLGFGCPHAQELGRIAGRSAGLPRLCPTSPRPFLLLFISARIALGAPECLPVLNLTSWTLCDAHTLFLPSWQSARLWEPLLTFLRDLALNMALMETAYVSSQ